MASIIGIITLLKPIIAPLITFLAGWLFPSPLQKAIDKQGEIHDAERKAQDSHGNVSDLDRLP